MEAMTLALLIAALGFAFVHGLNTGAALVATSTSLRTLPVVVSVLVLLAGVVAAPFVLGTAVATTLSRELVGWDADGGRTGMLVAVVVTIAVILVLSYLRVPTSMSIALIGAITGFGLATGTEVHWDAVMRVLAVIALAPVAGAVAAAIIMRVLRRVWPRRDVRGFLAIAHTAAFATLSFAYGSNDAQKMLAVISIAVGFGGAQVPVVPWQILTVGGLFAIGTVCGLGRMTRTMSTGILAARPFDIVTTELAATATMLASTALGAPAGLAQTLSGGLIGSGMTQGMRRVRWQHVSKLVTAWGLTLPSSVLLAAGVGFLVR